jgi:phage tail-like protein
VPRLGLEELESGSPISQLLPGMLADDEFAQRFASAFDTILAPVLATLDCIDSYFDPWLAPKDFLEWLATWVAIELDELLPQDRQRLLVSEAVRLYRMRGTAIGLAEQIAIYTGLEVEITESGGSTWSAAPGGAPPGENYPRLTVKLITSDPGSVDVNRVNVLVSASKPAHLPHTIELGAEESGGVVGAIEEHRVAVVEETEAVAPAEEPAAPAEAVSKEAPAARRQASRAADPAAPAAPRPRTRQAGPATPPAEPEGPENPAG